MRSVTDKLKISREKLSYIVDSTAAPVAAIAFITTWIGAELGYIEHTSNHIPEISSQVSVYSIFVNSLQYSFYPILTLIFIFILTMKKRDFGPMYKAEERARTSGEVKKKDSQSMNNEVEELNPAEHVKPRGINALIPILTIIIGTITGLFITGKNACYTDLSSIIPNLNDSFTSVWGSLQELPNNPHTFIQKLGTIIGASDSYSALLWSSLSGVLIAVLLTVSQRILKLDETINSAIKGFKTMLNAVLILVLAWSLAKITENLHTADFITSLLGEGFKPWLVPALSFVLAALVAFSTGSSWGTMAILYPLVLPAAWKVCQLNGFSFDESMMIFNNVVSTVLAGSVLGDHCSPISDTTILSSLASSCNHIDHVKTQLPYALTVGLVAVVFGTIPSALGVSSLILFPVTIAVLYGIIHFLGKKLPE
ncbi:MAG: hypothetical protein C0594_02395 [Marinilabiliales bacterium]|nr:MAG: hypothetical protein C0594_02395 [Marinilabiliales bacterium]